MQFFHANKGYEDKFTVAVIPPNLTDCILALTTIDKKVKISFGLSRLHPDDNYSKKIGRDTAFSKISVCEFNIEYFSYCDITKKYTIQFVNNSSLRFLFHLKENHSVMKLIRFTICNKFFVKK